MQCAAAFLLLRTVSSCFFLSSSVHAYLHAWTQSSYQALCAGQETEPLHILINAALPKAFTEAVSLAQSLLDTVKDEHVKQFPYEHNASRTMGPPAAAAAGPPAYGPPLMPQQHAPAYAGAYGAAASYGPPPGSAYPPPHSYPPPGVFPYHCDGNILYVCRTPSMEPSFQQQNALEHHAPLVSVKY
jgi:hypothetical protein